MTEGQPVEKKKGLSTLAWVGIGCGVVLLLAVLAVGACSIFVVSKVGEIGDELQDNPVAFIAENLVRVSPESREAYRALVRGARLPDGTTVAKFHFERESGAPGPVYAMHKNGGAWNFLVASSEGQLEQRGDLDLCRRCHAEAVADSLFGPPGRFPAPRLPSADGGDPSAE